MRVISFHYGEKGTNLKCITDGGKEVSVSDSEFSRYCIWRIETISSLMLLVSDANGKGK